MASKSRLLPTLLGDEEGTLCIIRISDSDGVCERGGVLNARRVPEKGLRALGRLVGDVGGIRIPEKGLRTLGRLVGDVGGSGILIGDGMSFNSCIGSGVGGRRRPEKGLRALERLDGGAGGSCRLIAGGVPFNSSKVIGSSSGLL